MRADPTRKRLISCSILQDGLLSVNRSRRTHAADHRVGCFRRLLSARATRFTDTRRVLHLGTCTILDFESHYKLDFCPSSSPHRDSKDEAQRRIQASRAHDPSLSFVKMIPKSRKVEHTKPEMKLSLQRGQPLNRKSNEHLSSKSLAPYQMYKWRQLNQSRMRKIIMSKAQMSKMDERKSNGRSVQTL